MPAESVSETHPFRGPFGRPEADAAARKVLLDWHRQLDEQYRGDRARLRRARDLTEIQLEPVVHRLRRRLASEADLTIEPRRRPHFAVMVALLATVREHGELGKKQGQGLGAWLAQPKAGSKSPVLSELRFRRFITLEEPEALLDPTRRILRLLGGRIDLFELAQTLYRWNSTTRVRVAEQYYDRAHLGS